jgi:ParB family transcriptional regulator, chromosome partitioning protein
MKNEPDRNPRKALGKGLSALLPSRAAAPVPEVNTPGPVNPLPAEFENFRTIPLDQIFPNQAQPRTSFDSEKLEELSRSIKINGLLQPITAYRESDNRYIIIAGERRWRAAKLAGLTEIPTLIRTAEQQERLELALIENIQREDLNPIEIAVAFQNLASEHGLNHEEIAERTGKERSTVTNFIRLLRLSAPLQSAIISGHITMGHATCLLSANTKRRLIGPRHRTSGKGKAGRVAE